MFLKRNDRHLGVGTCKRTEANFSKTLKAAKRAEADPGGGLRGFATLPLGSFETCLAIHV